MSYKNTIKTLEDLIEYGIKKQGYEDENYLYIWADDADRDQYDSSFYRYDKRNKTLNRFPSVIDFFPVLNLAKKIDMNTDYLKSFL